MGKSIYPVIIPVAVATILAVTGCSSRAPLSPLQQQTEAEFQAAELTRAKGVRLRQEGKTQVIADNAATQVALTHDQNLRRVAGQTSTSYGHAYGNRGSGYCTGSMHGVTVDINGDVYVDVDANATPRCQGHRAPRTDITH